jgi:nucleoside-diphosphate-sugar epimerase
VTGGLGFIGSNLSLALADAGADVVIADALIPQHGGDVLNIGESSRRIEVVQADIADRDALLRPLEGVDVVFSLAGQVSHVDSMADPLFDLDVNTRSHLAFLETVRRVDGNPALVYTSTRQIFGHPRYLPVDEEHPVSPVDVNGVNKYATEQFYMLYGEIYGMRSTAVRLTNVYGPRQRLRDDRQGFLPIFIRRSLEGEALQVFGDGSQERDCLYVDDVVECLMLAATTQEAVGQIFNIGNDERLTLSAIAESIVRATGSGRIEYAPWPPDRDAIDIGSYFGDSSKAKRILGWKPRTTFYEGIAATVGFYRAHREWYL